VQQANHLAAAQVDGGNEFHDVPESLALARG
jgi:hypothetical protein